MKRRVAEKSFPTPIIKWVGGKTQILERVIGLFPERINNYHEPFLGGGSVLLAFLQNSDIQLKGKVYASDINPYLIYMYKNIQSNVEQVLECLDEISTEYKKIPIQNGPRNPKNFLEALKSQESYYYYYRSQFNSLSLEDKQGCWASALFIFLNKTCFRGVYREGPNGFNVPFGNNKNVSIFTKEHLTEISKLIETVDFQCQSFEASICNVQKDDFVYLDPPYAPLNELSFVKYIESGFDLDKHNLLFSMCYHMPCKFLLSNANVLLVQKSFSDTEKFSIEVIVCRRAIHSSDPSAKAEEVLIKNF